MKENQHVPTFGRAGALAGSALITVVVSGVGLAVLNAPQEAEQSATDKANVLHDQQQQQIDKLRSEIDELRKVIGIEGREVERLDGRINELSTRENERQQAYERSLDTLKHEIVRLWDYFVVQRAHGNEP